MKRNPPSKPIEIASAIKSGKPFWVEDNRARISALKCAKYLGVDVISRKADGGGFDILMPEPVVR